MNPNLMATKTGATKPGPVGTAILEQFADLPMEGITPDIARKLLEVGFAKTHHRRVKDLSDQAREGALTPAEADELDEYLRVADLLSILHSRARRALNNSGHSS